MTYHSFTAGVRKPQNVYSADICRHQLHKFCTFVYLIFMEDGIHAYSENATTLWLFTFVRNFLVQECNRIEVFPPTPSNQTETMGFFTLYTNGAVRVNTAKVAAETRKCKQESWAALTGQVSSCLESYCNRLFWILQCNATLISCKGFFQINFESNGMYHKIRTEVDFVKLLVNQFIPSIWYTTYKMNTEP